jgi:hypothetical protein
MFPDQGQREARYILRKQNAIAVINQTACRNNRLDMDAIIIGFGGIVFVLVDLQVKQAGNKSKYKKKYDYSTDEDARQNDLPFELVIL